MAWLRRHLRGFPPYRALRRGFNAVRTRETMDRRVASLSPDGPPRGNVLLSYINEPFFLPPGEELSTAHTHYWESREMARAFLDLGYVVDVINYANSEFVPEKEYAAFIDPRFNLERMSPYLGSDCVRIMHSDTAHALFHNAAEARRLLDLQQRRGVTLRPRRYMPVHLGTEHADHIMTLGNEFTMSTFRFSGKPIHRIPISAPMLYPWQEDKDFSACRRHYLWIGSSGMVHKGLDLVLEAFAGLSEHHLTVCGPVEQERDFVAAYRRELYDTPNIHMIGWVDIAAAEFREIARRCIGLIYPSCSEGGGGSAVICMHAGLIPVLSYEASVDVSPEYGLRLRDCSIEEIRQAVCDLSDRPTETLKDMARAAWEFARAHHTREKYGEEYRRVIGEILSAHRG